MPTTIQHIPDELITKALALTGKKIWDMEEHIDDGNGCYECGISTKSEFSMRVFCYYLLSHEFIEKYAEMESISNWCMSKKGWYTEFGIGIGEHQSGNSEPLINLLEKI